MTGSADAVSRDGRGRGESGEELRGHLEGPGGATPTIWLAVVGIIIGFVVTGLGLVLTSHAVFWAGLAGTVLCGVWALAAGIMSATH